MRDANDRKRASSSRNMAESFTVPEAGGRWGNIYAYFLAAALSLSSLSL